MSDSFHHPSWRRCLTTLLLPCAAVAFQPMARTSRLSVQPNPAMIVTSLFAIGGTGGDDDNDDKFMQVPLLDLLDDANEDVSEIAKSIVIPLPSSHLPQEISTPFLYGMQLERPVHKLLIDEAASQTQEFFDINKPQRMYGHLIWKNGNSYEGAIGCTAEILINAPASQAFSPEAGLGLSPTEFDLSALDPDNESSGNDSATNTVLCRGGYRFIVKKVVRTIPYPIVKIEKLMDDNDEEELIVPSATQEEEEEEDDGDDMYADLSTGELMQKILQNMQMLVKQKLEEANENAKISPLEVSILEESGVKFNPADAEKMQAEEMAAVFEVFHNGLIELDISLEDRPYAIAFMAAEMADMGNSIRKELLLTRSPRERLQIVWKQLNEKVGMAVAAKMASTITDANDELSRDLKVGSPSLPAWAKDIRKGTRVEYFWSENDGWFAGEVLEEPSLVVDELLITVLFDDGEKHCLPFSADEKIRWRPGSL